MLEGDGVPEESTGGEVREGVPKEKNSSLA